GVIKELVIRRPPERIVHHNRPVERRIFQISPIERNILRDTVNDEVVLLRLIHPDPANLHKLCRNALDPHRVDLLHHRRRKRVLHPKQNPNSSQQCAPPFQLDNVLLATRVLARFFLSSSARERSSRAAPPQNASISAEKKRMSTALACRNSRSVN